MLREDIGYRDVSLLQTRQHYRFDGLMDGSRYQRIVGWIKEQAELTKGVSQRCHFYSPKQLCGTAVEFIQLTNTNQALGVRVPSLVSQSAYPFLVFCNKEPLFCVYMAFYDQFQAHAICMHSSCIICTNKCAIYMVLMMY